MNKLTFTILILPLIFGLACGPKSKNIAWSSIDNIDTIPFKSEIIPSISFDTLEPNKLLDYLMGKFDPSAASDFAEIMDEHADRSGLYLHSETYEAFKQMYEHALRDSIHLVIRSATRNFDQQKTIWEKKWNGVTNLSSGRSAADIPDEKQRCLEILKYSSMPGSSRHHWGTDIDLNAFNNQYFESGEGKSTYDWLVSHAATYGFCQPYCEKNIQRPTGYEEEKWHWSYMPLSKRLTSLAKRHMNDRLIKGFAGAEQALHIEIVNNFVLGINSACTIED